MKKSFYRTIFFAVLLLGTLDLLTTVAKVSATGLGYGNVAIFNEPQPFYIKEGSLIEIGQLDPNFPFAIVNEDEAFYELLFGQTSVYVKKTADSALIEERIAISTTETYGAIKTAAVTNVYKHPNALSVRLLQLEAGYRYPVVSKQGNWFVVKVGEQLGYINDQTVPVDTGIPVLLYHHLLPQVHIQDPLSTVAVEAFDQQMDYLATKQFKTIGVRDLYEYLEGQRILPSHTVLITFDDGLLSTKEYAYPLLKKHQLIAVQHIISSRVQRTTGRQQFNPEGKFQFLTAEELALISDVFTYEAHTHNLHALDDISKRSRLLHITSRRLKADLRINLSLIPTAVAFAYPYGQYNQHSIEVLKELNFLIGFTTKKGYAHTSDSNYEIKRFAPTVTLTMEDFISYVQGEMYFR